MPKRNPSRTDLPRKRKRTGRRARAGRQTLCSEKIGALPILNSFIGRLQLEELLREFLLPDDKRVKIPAHKARLVLLRNLLISREPLYGIGVWAASYAPDLLGLTRDEWEALSDDATGRAMGALFRCEQGALVLAVVRHTIRQFEVALEELHNDSTTITFHGRLIFILTLSEDGGAPLHFRAANGNASRPRGLVTEHAARWPKRWRRFSSPGKSTTGSPSPSKNVRKSIIVRRGVAGPPRTPSISRRCPHASI